MSARCHYEIAHCTKAVCRMPTVLVAVAVGFVEEWKRRAWIMQGMACDAIQRCCLFESVVTSVPDE